MATEADEIFTAAVALPVLAELLERVGADFEPGIWLVGGAVRDLLLGHEPTDVDLMVDGEFDALTAVLGDPAVTHDEYLTATVGGFDLARSRVETYSEPGALPQVRPAGVTEDLRRRDFGVNAIALCLTGRLRGELLSVPGGVEDLRAHELRVLHPSSFLDDPTRLFRLARYVARLDFSVEARTLELAGQAIGGGALSTLSGVRIGNELRRLAGEPDPVRAFAALRELGLDAAVDPILGVVDDSLARRALALLEPPDRRDRTMLAVALLGAGRDAAVGLLDRLGFVAEDRDVISAAAVNAQRISQRLEFAGPPSAIDWAAGGRDGVAETVAVAGAIHPANAAREWLVELRHRRLSITGHDLLAAGVAPGPALGVGLEAARAAMMDERAMDAVSQLEVAVTAAGGAGRAGG